VKPLYISHRVALTLLQKCTVVLRQLAYGIAVDTIDEYLKVGKSMIIQCLEHYCVGIIECYKAKCLRRPIIDDT
jgi:hypothetical protein